VALGQDAEQQVLRACARCLHYAACAGTTVSALCDRTCSRPAALCRRAEVAGAVLPVPVSSAPARAASVLFRAQPFWCLLYATSLACDSRLCAAARKMLWCCACAWVVTPVARACWASQARAHLQGHVAISELDEPAGREARACGAPPGHRAASVRACASSRDCACALAACVSVPAAC
jgi:hypothetical protein